MRVRDLVVLALILLMAGGLLLHGIGRVRDAARCARCHNNLRQIGLAVNNYHDTYSHFPQATLPNPDLPPERRLSWLFVLVPFMESNDWYRKAAKDKAWDAEENLHLPPYGLFYVCPSAFPGSEPGPGQAPSTYVGIAGLGPDAGTLPEKHLRAGFFGYERKLTRRDLMPSGGLLVGLETTRVGDSWLAGGPATVRGLEPESLPYLGDGEQFGGLHRRGTTALFADSSVRLLSNETAPAVLEKIATIAGSAAVGQVGEE
jgi:hypothetical protein